jgi:septal ring factor EnvC (AmiA/AmiB activator)
MPPVNQRLHLELGLYAAVVATLVAAPCWTAGAQTTPRPPGEVPYLTFPPTGFPPAISPPATSPPAAPAPTDASSAVQDSPPAVDTLERRERELKTIQSEHQKSEAAASKIRREIETAGEDRRKLNRQLLEVAARVRDIETQIGAAEARVKPLDAQEAALRKSLDDRREVTARVLAAMQRIGRNPPPALLVRPEDALQSVRSALLLGAVLPDMRRDVEALVADLSELARVRRSIAAERAGLARNLTRLAEDQMRIAVLMEQRRKQQTELESTLAAERQRASELAKEVDNLQDLIAKLEKNLDPKTRAARIAGRSGDAPASGNNRRDLVALKDPGRLAPAVAFASAKRTLPLPVNGVRIRDYGAPDGVGGREKGLSIATRAGAQITAPCDGWVVYSGPFRNYGQLLILNAGDGYHVLLAGMERISVELGQFVVTGEPVAMMGGRAQASAAIAIGSGQPVLYVEFRKDGTPIDPGPWWAAASDSEKVRG